MLKDLKEILEKYDLKPNKLLGQNFLVDQNILEKIIASSALSKADTVLEVGPGLGILTEALAREAGRVVAIEKDREIAEILKRILAEKNIGNVEVIQGDILKSEEPAIKQLNNYKLIANIPYYLTSRLIRNFLESKNKPQEIILMIQKEVAQRICSEPPKMSLLSASVQFYADPEILFYVSKESFWPAPKVDSALIKIKPKQKISEVPPQKFFKIIHAGFSQPRKQLINNLSTSLEIEREKISEILKKSGLKPEQRAETLSLEDWIKLSDILQ